MKRHQCAACEAMEKLNKSGGWSHSEICTMLTCKYMEYQNGKLHFSKGGRRILRGILHKHFPEIIEEKIK